MRLAAIAVLAALSACQPRQLSREAMEAPETFQCHVTNVVDGDTWDCGRRVRAFGYQAPEKGEALWRDSKMALDYMILDKTLDCIPQSTDRYGRTVALCFLGDIDIGAEMVGRGVAAACPGYTTRYEAIDKGRVPRPTWCRA